MFQYIFFLLRTVLTCSRLCTARGLKIWQLLKISYWYWHEAKVNSKQAITNQQASSILVVHCRRLGTWWAERCTLAWSPAAFKLHCQTAGWVSTVWSYLLTSDSATDFFKLVGSEKPAEPRCRSRLMILIISWIYDSEPDMYVIALQLMYTKHFLIWIHCHMHEIIGFPKNVIFFCSLQLAEHTEILQNCVCFHMIWIKDLHVQLASFFTWCCSNPSSSSSSSSTTTTTTTTTTTCTWVIPSSNFYTSI